MGRADLLQSYNHYLGDPDRITWDLDRYRNATPAAVQAVAARFLDLDTKVVVITNPAVASPAAGGAP